MPELHERIILKDDVFGLTAKAKPDKPFDIPIPMKAVHAVLGLGAGKSEPA